VDQLRTKRIYEDPDPADGSRILVDRLWPRGVSKNAAALDDWAKELAPTDELREWYDHDPDRWEGFRERYMEELDERQAAIQATILDRPGTVTLLYAARDTERNNAVVLKEHAEDLDTERSS
jgi:uncharacterized protein YeaO (DUF488 family)